MYLSLMAAIFPDPYVTCFTLFPINLDVPIISPDLSQMSHRSKSNRHNKNKTADISAVPGIRSPFTNKATKGPLFPDDSFILLYPQEKFSTSKLRRNKFTTI